MVEYIPLFNNNSGLIYIPREYLPISTFLVIYRVGSRDESKREHGLSHFLEHMFFKGTSTLTRISLKSSSGSIINNQRLLSLGHCQFESEKMRIADNK